jgi:hypothetical protein
MGIDDTAANRNIAALELAGGTAISIDLSMLTSTRAPLPAKE